MTIGTVTYRWRWAILTAWLAAGVALVTLVPPADPTANEAESFLPSWAPSREGAMAFRQYFPATSGLSEAVVVFERRSARLTAADLEAIEAVARKAKVMPPDPAAAKELAGITVQSPGKLKDQLNIKSRENPLISSDGRAALVTVSSPANFITVRACRAVDHLRKCLDATSLPEGLQAEVTGSAGYGHDYLLAAQRSHDKTLKITIAAVVLILLLVYRSPGAAMVPVVAVSAAVVIAMKVLALGTRVGLHVGTAEMIFVVVLMYGAGVDYSLMLVSRYRELLDEGLSPRDAAVGGLDATLPAILASAGTNTVGLFMLTFATHGVFHTSGPVIAIALTCALIAAVTLVPALLAAIGPAIFWPSRRMGQIGSTRLWPAVARATIARPALVLVAVFVLLGIPAVRGANLQWVYDALTGLTTDYSARRGTEIAQRHWSEGETTPVRVLVESKAPLTETQWRRAAETITASLDAWGQVGNVRSLTWPLGKGRPRFAPPATAPASGPARPPTGIVDTLAPYLPSGPQLASTIRRNEIFKRYVSPDRRAMQLDVVLTHPGFSLPALDAAEALPARILSVLPVKDPPRIYLAGITAETLDVKHITRHDVVLISTLVLAVIFIMVVALLRDMLLSLFMIVSTLLSYLATLGLTYWIFAVLAGAEGLDWKVQVFLFVVMVAVGQDYNIYLAARLAQEALVADTREAIRRAVVRTGPVISSCGVIMAATLGSLAAGDITLLTQLGVAMALGMLIDTFIVRPLLLPSFAALTNRTGTAKRKPVA